MTIIRNFLTNLRRFIGFYAPFSKEIQQEADHLCEYFEHPQGQTMKRDYYSEQSGFTLLELIVALVIVSVLAALAMSAFTVYQSAAGYSVAVHTIRDAGTALRAGIMNDDNPPVAVEDVAQRSRGLLQNESARELLVGLALPGNLKFQVRYDPTCLDEDCEAGFIQVNHCQAKEYLQLVRFGDGYTMLLDHLAGDGCA